MIQKKIDETADRYMMLTNKDRRTKLLSVRKAEGIVSAFCFFLIYFGVGMVTASTTAHMDVEFEVVFFTVVLFIEVAICRTAKTAVPMWVLIVTSVVATVLSKFLMCYFIVYSIIFIIVEIKMAAMKNIPGYPLFEDIERESLGKDMTADQLMAYNKKLYNDLENAEAARTRDSKNLDKILSGEMDLDEFLGVDKIDTKNAKMDEVSEYHEPQATEPEEPKDDDSAEAFFKRFEKKGGSVQGKNNEKEKKSWLDGDDSNSAESYFGRFSQSGGRLDDGSAFKKEVIFRGAKDIQNGGKNV